MQENWNKVFLVTVSLISGSLIVGAVSAPILQHFLGYPHGEGVYSFLNPICHQYPTRSLWLFNRPMGLCARCVAGYAGIFAATILWRWSWSFKKRLAIGLFLFVVALVDPMVQLTTSYISSNETRVLTGLLGGFALSLVVFPLFPSKPEGSL